MPSLAHLSTGGARDADVAVDVGQGDTDSPELEFLGRWIHPRDPLLEPAAGADVSENRGHAGSMRLWNSSSNGEVFLKQECSILPACATPRGRFRTSDSHPTLPVRAPRRAVLSP